ncbi:hypothetical protein [Entomospira culicis]|uniref:Lipoprotein n=1 Tax=Entomospira culicis TaxID=2719989 RepID=A0A968KU08_9SPIO|nr:hypothetical protein [Entomospira culicis]NIZ18474.1 hypothetical protein [Entomospira culicis]NIZ68690.1 hypothetical protein [Entomospira culicis]WDI37289.1 hypothetical protein PVA46_00420 [Entomospira culicis]WDI38918.1 hypothetical protein PVA47_00430 [Entomospira culicis]
MKKLFFALISIAALSLVSCGGNKDNAGADNSNQSSTSASKPAAPKLAYVYSYADVTIGTMGSLPVTPLINGRDMMEVAQDPKLAQDLKFAEIMQNSTVEFTVEDPSIINFMSGGGVGPTSAVGAISGQKAGTTTVSYVVTYKDTTYEGTFNVTVTE